MRQTSASWIEVPQTQRRTQQMTTAYFSTVLDALIEEVWTTVRDFGAYEWAGSQYSAVIEDGRAGDAVGAIRRIGDDGAMRQRLVQLSDADHSFTYDILPGSPTEVDNYRATLQLRPITDTGKTFVEWSATFDCAPEDAEHWRHFYAGERFPTWLDALRSRVTA
jgi:Polyketide cyclase / dehydrase and lipid transport